MGAGLYFNKSLEVSAETMRQLRYEGLTNHQIAKRCGCSEATVYRYIGKKSLDVKNAAMTNKPSPVKQEVTTPTIKPAMSILAKSAETIIKEEPAMEKPVAAPKKVNNRKKLSADIISKIYEMHDQGDSALTISMKLGVGASTASRYITRYERSKGSDISEVSVKKLSQPKIKMKLVTMAKGELCDYKVDISTGSIDITGILQGILDRDTIDSVIDELTQIRNIVMG